MAPSCGQDCLEPEGFAQGEVILREGASLGSGAKFYLVESGAVECFKIYDQVSKLKHPCYLKLRD